MTTNFNYFFIFTINGGSSWLLCGGGGCSGVARGGDTSDRRSARPAKGAGVLVQHRVFPGACRSSALSRDVASSSKWPDYGCGT